MKHFRNMKESYTSSRFYKHYLQHFNLQVILESNKPECNGENYHCKNGKDINDAYFKICLITKDRSMEDYKDYKIHLKGSAPGKRINNVFNNIEDFHDYILTNNLSLGWLPHSYEIKNSYQPQ